jgi:hypothetical protein
MKITMGVCCYL